MSISDDIAKVLDLDAKATGGPWKPYELCVLTEMDESNTVRKVCDLAYGHYVHAERAKDNGNLIASYRTLAPRLAAWAQRVMPLVEAAEEYRRGREAIKNLATTEAVIERHYLTVQKLLAAALALNLEVPT